MDRVAQERVKVKVEVFGSLRQFTGRKDLEVELSLPTIEGLIRALTSLYGKDFEQAVASTSGEGFLVNILVNGKDIDFIGKSNTFLREGDTVTMMPLVAGG